MSKSSIIHSTFALKCVAYESLRPVQNLGVIPKDKRDLAAEEGISTENKENVTVQIMNLTTGESYLGRVPITGNRQTRLPLQASPAAEPLCYRNARVGGQSEAARGTSGQVYVPTEIQEMLKDSGTVRIQILGG